MLILSFFESIAVDLLMNTESGKVLQMIPIFFSIRLSYIYARWSN